MLEQSVTQLCSSPQNIRRALHQKRPNTEFFRSVFSCSQTEYADLRRKSPHLVRMRRNTDQKRLRIRTLFMQWCNSSKFHPGINILMLFFIYKPY